MATEVERAIAYVAEQWRRQQAEAALDAALAGDATLAAELRVDWHPLSTRRFMPSLPNSIDSLQNDQRVDRAN